MTWHQTRTHPGSTRWWPLSSLRCIRTKHRCLVSMQRRLPLTEPRGEGALSDGKWNLKTEQESSREARLEESSEKAAECQFRFDWCNRPCDSAAGLSAHKRRSQAPDWSSPGRRPANNPSNLAWFPESVGFSLKKNWEDCCTLCPECHSSALCYYKRSSLVACFLCKAILGTRDAALVPSSRLTGPVTQQQDGGRRGRSHFQSWRGNTNGVVEKTPTANAMIRAGFYFSRKLLITLMFGTIQPW